MLTINANRLLQNLNDLAQIGRTPAGGVSRPALSAADKAGRDWFKRRVEAARLEFRADGAGNLLARLPAAKPQAQTLLIGSHLDSVPNGGRFDGALGVLSGLEVLQTIKEAGLPVPLHLELVSFTDEEGSVVTMLGSRAITGQLDESDLAQARDGVAQLEAGLARLDLSRQSVLLARRNPDNLAGYIELHIEQGTRLEEIGLDIGVVTSIVGIRSFWLVFDGQAGHAGTTPMDRRADALWGTSAFVSRARELVMDRFSPGVMNCGQVSLAPGAFNIIPARVRLALEFRHGSEGMLDRMEAALRELAGAVATEYGLTLTIEPVGNCVAAPMANPMIEAVEQAANQLGLEHTRLLSLAGHDAQTMAPFTPSALFFVPSVDGISHNPRELTRDEDVINGANVLLHTVLALAAAE